MTPRINITFPLHWWRYVVSGNRYQPESNEFLLNHARTGLLLALQSMGLSKGSRVGVMIYNCHTVADAVIQAGFTPVFVDVNNSLQIDDADLRKKAQNMDALIVTHLFGIENDMSIVRSIVPNIPVIEDCAHAFGKVHTEGDFAVYSIGQGKFPSIGDGGIVVVNNSRYLKTIQQIYDRIPPYTAWQQFLLLCRLNAKAALYTPSIYSALTQHLKSKRKSVTKHSIEAFRMSDGIRAIYTIERQRTEVRIARQKQNADYWRTRMLDKAQDSIIGDNAFMLVVRTTDKNALKAWFAKQGIETATHFEKCIEWAVERGYKHGECPNAEKLTDELLMIPTYSL